MARLAETELPAEKAPGRVSELGTAKMARTAAARVPTEADPPNRRSQGRRPRAVQRWSTESSTCDEDIYHRQRHCADTRNCSEKIECANCGALRKTGHFVRCVFAAKFVAIETREFVSSVASMMRRMTNRRRRTSVATAHRRRLISLTRRSLGQRGPATVAASERRTRYPR